LKEEDGLQTSSTKGEKGRKVSTPQSLQGASLRKWQRREEGAIPPSTFNLRGIIPSLAQEKNQTRERGELREGGPTAGGEKKGGGGGRAFSV